MKFGFLNYARVNDKPELRQFICRTEQEAREMEEQLTQAQVPFQSLHDAEHSRFWLVRIDKKDFDMAYHCNIEVKSRHKSTLIADPVLRYFLLAVFGISVGLALIGALLKEFS